MAATAAAFFAFFTAGTAIGAADAFVSVLFGFMNIISGKTENYGKNNNYDNIFHYDCSFLFVLSVKP